MRIGERSISVDCFFGHNVQHCNSAITIHHLRFHQYRAKNEEKDVSRKQNSIIIAVFPLRAFALQINKMPSLSAVASSRACTRNTRNHNSCIWHERRHIFAETLRTHMYLIWKNIPDEPLSIAVNYVKNSAFSLSNPCMHCCTPSGITI